MLNKKSILVALVFFSFVTLVLAVSYTPPTFDSVNFTICSGYTVPNFDSINFTLDDSDPCVPSDSCTYTSGNWIVDCNDNCSITSPVDLGGNDISIIGHGTFTTTVDISNVGETLIAGDSSSLQCEVLCLNGGCFK